MRYLGVCPLAGWAGAVSAPRWGPSETYAAICDDFRYSVTNFVTCVFGREGAPRQPAYVSDSDWVLTTQTPKTPNRFWRLEFLLYNPLSLSTIFFFKERSATTNISIRT